jgi:hypothetical protein
LVDLRSYSRILGDGLDGALPRSHLIAVNARKDAATPVVPLLRNNARTRILEDTYLAHILLQYRPKKGGDEIPIPLAKVKGTTTSLLMPLLM